MQTKEALAPTYELRERLEHAVNGGTVSHLKAGNVIVRDPVMAALQCKVERIASARVSVIILGESGVGKDVIASMLHERSTRARGPFVRVNCASLHAQLLETELFGHERGAFTGACHTKPGLLEVACGGTVFLDELGELPVSIQSRLLHAIENREVLRLGGLRPRGIDVRFVAATNRDLAREVAENRFRLDLYYRLNGIRLTVPPLRERPLDIEPLTELFLEQARPRLATAGLCLSEAARKALAMHRWPGNVRELRNVIDQAVLLACGDLIEPEDLDLDSLHIPTQAPGEEAAPVGPRQQERGRTRLDRDELTCALSSCGGNQSRAAAALGVSRRTVVRAMSRFGLPRPKTSQMSH